MLKNLITSFQVERLKVKGTFTYWFTLGGALLVPTVFFLIYAFRNKHFIPAAGDNPWDLFIKSNVQTVAFFLFSFHVILTIAINIQIEHREDSWKKIFVLPFSRATFYWSKLLFLLSQILVSQILFSFAVLLYGVLLGIIFPDLRLLDVPPNLQELLEWMVRLFVSVLGIVSIQYVLTLMVKNVTIPITVGIFLSIVASIINKGWGYSVYFPYAFPLRFFLSLSPKLPNQITTEIITISEYTSLIVFVVVCFTGSWIFQQKRLR